MPDAILFDYDNTLADTITSNLAVTFEVLRRLGHPGPAPWPLRSLTEYRRANYLFVNWRDMYIKGFGLTEEETTAAGALWAPAQAAAESAPALFPGIPDMLMALQGIPLGVCSQNSAEVIRRALCSSGLDGAVSAFVGHEDVPPECQKPHPAGFLSCLDSLGVTGGSLAYVGDHPEDMAFAKNAEEALRAQGVEARIYRVAAMWCGGNRHCPWPCQPDLFAETPAQAAEFLKSV